MPSHRHQHIISEDVTKGDVHGIVKDHLDGLLNGRDFKKSVREIAADVLDDFFKNLYTKKNLWKSHLQNS